MAIYLQGNRPTPRVTEQEITTLATHEASYPAYEEIKVGDKFGNFTLISKTGRPMPEDFTLVFSGEAVIRGHYVPVGEFSSVAFSADLEDVGKLPVIDGLSSDGRFCFLNIEFAAKALPGLSMEELSDLVVRIPSEPVTGKATVRISGFRIIRSGMDGCGESTTLMEVISKEPDISGINS